MEIWIEFAHRTPEAAPGVVPIPLGTTLTVGRSVDQAHILVQAHVVSRRHCEIGRLPCAAWIRDLGSRNGTHLNGKPCVPHTVYTLRPGDRVGICDVFFRIGGNTDLPRAWPYGEPGLVERLARCVREARDFETIPILADALEDAGCTDPAMFDHLRGPYPHTRDCWVLEAILGRRVDFDGGASPARPVYEAASMLVIRLVEETPPGTRRYTLGLSARFNGTFDEYQRLALSHGFRALSTLELCELEGRIAESPGRLLGWEAHDGRVLYEYVEELD